MDSEAGPVKHSTEADQQKSEVPVVVEREPVIEDISNSKHCHLHTTNFKQAANV